MFDISKFFYGTEWTEQTALEMRRLMASIFVGLVLSASIYCGLIQEEPGYLSVSANVQLERVPDVALVRIGFRSEVSTNQKQVYNQAANFANLFTDTLESYNVDRSEFTLDNVSVRKEYISGDVDRSDDMFRGYVSFKVKIGPETSSSIGISGIIAQAVELGANDVGSLSYAFEDEDVFNERLRVMASGKLKKKAESIANLYSVKLGKMKEYSEHNFDSPPVYMSAHRAMAFDSEVSSVESVDINPGTQVVSMDVSATFELK